MIAENIPLVKPPAKEDLARSGDGSSPQLTYSLRETATGRRRSGSQPKARATANGVRFQSNAVFGVNPQPELQAHTPRPIRISDFGFLSDFGFRISDLNPPRLRRGFTIIEILMAVTLMSVLIFGLLTMFSQVQRASHLGMAQVDLMESGRVTMQFINEEFERISASDRAGVINLIATNSSTGPLTFSRAPNPGIRCQLQNLFFISRQNDRWLGIGYRIDPPSKFVGSLYRYTNSAPISESPIWLYDEFRKSSLTNFHRLADRVVSFQATPYDRNGVISSNLTTFDEFVFQGSELPASLDLELAILDQKTYLKYLKLTNSYVDVVRFLPQQVDHVSLFRRRIPVRSGL